MQFPFKLSVVEMKFYFFVVVSRLKRETWHKIFSISFSLFSTRLIIIVEDSFSFHRMESVMIKENKTVLCCTREKKFVQCFFTLSNIVSRVLRSREDSFSFEWLQTFLIELNLKTFNWNLESFSSLENFHNFSTPLRFSWVGFKGRKEVSLHAELRISNQIIHLITSKKSLFSYFFFLFSWWNYHQTFHRHKQKQKFYDFVYFFCLSHFSFCLVDDGKLL